MAEYAVLFAVVIGAAVAVQQYIKRRLQGTVQDYTDRYQADAASAGLFDPTRRSLSSSGTDQTFTSARAGTVLGTGGSLSKDVKSTD
jgi:hypothetical protein